MSKFLSLDWFKEKVDYSIEKVIEKKLDNLINQEEENEISLEVEKPYKNIVLVNNTLTIILSDYSVISKPEATENDFKNAKLATTIEELYSIVSDNNVITERKEEEKQIIKSKAYKEGLTILLDTGEFTVEQNVVYFKDISRSIPELLVDKFIEIAHRVSNESSQEVFNVQLNNDPEYLAHKNFFMWCCLNPRAEVANELYRFLNENSFRITKQGFFVALRNVVTLHGSPELVHFVSNAYNKVKAVWKKSADDYTVFLENGEYKLIHNDKLFKEEIHTTTTCPDCLGEGVHYDYDEDDYIYCDTCDGTGEVEEYTTTEKWSVSHGEKIGKLTELYLDLPNRKENRFTDDWTKTFDIRIGKVVNMPKEDCNWSTQDCAAAGLHFTADQIHYVGCGDQSVMVLINPMKVVGIGQHKGRCYEYLPFMTVPREEATKILHDNMFDTLELDEDYAIRELQDLKDKAKEGFVVETSKHQFNLPNVSTNDIYKIVESLEEMKKQIDNRIVSID
jgi:hypothetical protein